MSTLLAAVRLCVFCLAALLALPTAALAQERILAYDSEVRINADASLDVTEHITVRAEGDDIRRGIYRDFPTRYRDRYGNRVVVDFEVIDVQRDGRREPWFSERIGNGVRVNTGNDDFLPVPATYTYTLRYRTARQLGFFADHDELYWNAIGHGWAFPIERGSVTVRLPQPVPPAQMQAEGYSGSQGARGDGFAISLPAAGVARWTLTQPLAPGEGLTIVLSFPKGVVAAPTRQQRLLWLLQENRGVLIALFVLFALAGYCLLRWYRVGRDPPAGTVIVRYEPPAGHSPGGLRYMTRMAYDTRCLSADLLASAVAGAVRIERDEGLVKDRWQLMRGNGGDADIATAEQRTLLAALFASAEVVTLDKDSARTMQRALAQHSKALLQRFQPALFERNGGSIAIALLIAVLGSFAAFAASGGSGQLLIIGVCAVMVAVLIAFVILVKAPTIEGRRLLDEIAGFRRYLSVAEGDELARVPAPENAEASPPLDAERFERLLPYAVALDVEEAWTKRFTQAVGAAAAAQATANLAWYRGGGRGDLAGLTNALGSGLSAQIASSSTPPGSSSGGGGGGFSGGGGGGGGGGGR